MHLPATHSSSIYDSTYKSVRKSDKDFIIAFISSSFVQYVIMMIRCQQGFCIDASQLEFKFFFNEQKKNTKVRTTIDLLVGFISFNHSTALNLLHFITKILMLLTTMTNRQLHGFEWDGKKWNEAADVLSIPFGVGLRWVSFMIFVWKNIQAWNGAFIFGTVADQLLTKLEASGGFNYTKKLLKQTVKAKVSFYRIKCVATPKFRLKF